MKIKTMTASFGKLRGARLELGEGLNLIQLENEGGKSTWCAFLRAMLYGVPTRERDRQGYIAEKNRYQPWDGGAMEGEMTLSWQGRELTLRRGPKGNVPFGSFSAVYTGTGEAVPGLTAENCGETLLGVSREVYERSAFVGQGGAGIGHDAELERRIASLVSSGEEDVSFSETESRLKGWLNRRRHNRTGHIPKLEQELETVEEGLTLQARAHHQAEEARREIEGLTDRQQALSTALEYYRIAEGRAQYEKYRAAQSALTAARAEVEALEGQAEALPDGETLRAAQGELAYYNTLEANRRMAESQIGPARDEAEDRLAAAEDACFPDMTADQAWQQAQQDRARAAAKPRKTALFYLPPVLLGLGLLWFGFLALLILRGGEMQPWMYGVLVALAMVILAANSINAKKNQTWNRETEALLARYGAEYPDDILTRANTYRERTVAAQEAARKLEAVERSAADLAGQKEALLQGLLDTVHPFEAGVTDVFGLSAALSKALSLRGRLAEARVRLEGAETLAGSLSVPQAPPEEGETPLPKPDQAPEALAAQLAAVEGELSRRKNDLALATGELNTYGDGADNTARQERLREELERYGEEYQAIQTALEALRDANTTLRARFSPTLNATAGEILKALTGGRYDAVGLNRQFEAEAREAGSTLPRSTLSLSQGAAEQVYLAVRLAVCDLALPREDMPPLVLDDALDAFDDGRMALALDYLLKRGERGQILLFSCHSREGRYLADKGCNHTVATV